MATDRDILTSTIKGELDGTAAAAVGVEVKKMLRVGRRWVTLHHTTNTAAANISDIIVETATDAAFTNGYRVTAFRVTPFQNLTADNTNNVILTLTKYAGTAGAAGTTVATVNTAATAGGGTGDLTRRVTYNVTVNTTTSEVAANSVLTLTVLNAGTSTASQNLAGAQFDVLFEAL